MSALPPEVTTYELGVQTLYLHDWAEGTDLYKRAGETTDPAEMASHDGPVLLDGDRDAFRRVEESEFTGYTAYHPHGGRMDSFAPENERHAVKLTRVERSDR
jgi:hypothetical protein